MTASEGSPLISQSPTPLPIYGSVTQEKLTSKERSVAGRRGGAEESRGAGQSGRVEGEQGWRCLFEVARLSDAISLSWW